MFPRYFQNDQLSAPTKIGVDAAVEDVLGLTADGHPPLVGDAPMTRRHCGSRLLRLRCRPLLLLRATAHLEISKLGGGVKRRNLKISGV